MIRVSIVGLGLIGGSLGAALRATGSYRVTGWDADPRHLREALTLGLVDEASAGPAGAAASAEIVVLAVPVGSLIETGLALVPAVPGGAVLTDVGSTKAAITEALDAALPGRFVGGHPIAGTERSGPTAAQAELFAGKLLALTRTPRTEEAALQAVEKMWRAAGVTRVVVQAAAEHDRVFAAVSHLPHLAVFSLCAALGDLDEPDLAALAGFGLAGFVDTTRIAGSSPRTWTDIFLANRTELLRLARLYRTRLDVLCRAVEEGDSTVLLEEIARAGSVRRRVLGL